MPRNNVVRYLLVIIGMSTASCASSPPVHFHTLDPQPSAGVSTAAVQSVHLQVARVRIPPTLDRQQIVREAAEGALSISDRERWSAPLDQMIERTLTLDLRELLSPNSVVFPPRISTPSADRVAIDIDRFMPVPGGEIQLRGSWSMVSQHQSCTYRIELSARPASSAYADQVRTMSGLVAKLATSIGDVATARGAEPEHCEQP